MYYGDGIQICDSITSIYHIPFDSAFSFSFDPICVYTQYFFKTHISVLTLIYDLDLSKLLIDSFVLSQ